MRLTETSNDTTSETQPDKKSNNRGPAHHRDAAKLRKTAEALMSTRYESPAGKPGALHLRGRLKKWAEAAELDDDRRTEVGDTLNRLENVCDDLLIIATWLEGLSDDFNPGGTKRKAKLTPGEPCRIKQAKLDEVKGLGIEDPDCLRVVALKKSMALVQTPAGERIYLDKSLLDAVE